MLSQLISRARILAVLALLLNAYVLFTPAGPGLPLFPYADKVVHAAIFAAPAALGTLAGWSDRVLLPALACYAVGSEIVQWQLLSTRAGSAGDVLADLAGIAAGLAIGRWLVTRAPGGRERMAP